MTDQPGSEPEQRLPVPRPPSEVAPAERFSAPPSIHSESLTPERAATIVRQSASARWIGLVATVVVVLFVIVYYFYELGVPGLANTSRLGNETAAQQITSVERGYTIYQANCARCHGVDGQGGIGPILHDQSKLYTHLNANYIANVLYAGGRYVCGNANSLMPVWAVANGGTLNYVQIQDVINFIRAPSDQTFTVRNGSTREPVADPSTGKVQTFAGWRDINYKPLPNATPVPACWSSAFTSTPGPGGSLALPSPTIPLSSIAGPVLSVKAQNIAFDPTTLSVASGQPFSITFDNEDAGIPHNIDIKDAAGASVFKGDIFNGVATQTYQVASLLPGTYTFVCDVHPNMTGTLTVK